MILGRSVGKYQSFFCMNASSGIKGCTNRGYKSARIVDEAVLRTVMATLFTDDFIADLTADVNKRLAWIARQPIPSTKKLEREIVNEDRQLKRLTERLAKLDDTHLDAVLTKAEEMGRQLAAKRERLKELQRAGRRPRVKSVRETDVRAALGNRIYGCDDCLAACPWNKFAQSAREAAFTPRAELQAPLLSELAGLDDATFRTRFSGTAVKRIGRDRFVRNVAYALGNSGVPATSLPAVERLLMDASPLVRGAAVWALSQLAPEEAARRGQTTDDPDANVRAEWAEAFQTPLPR